MQMIATGNDVFTRRLAEELALVESRFAAELLSDLTCVNSLVNHVESFRGKMLRPTLVLVSSSACRPEAAEPLESQRILATVTEMVHMATLVHDDILDEADMRRQGRTVNKLSGNEAAVMLGDYLISHAYHLCSGLDRTDISRSIARATNVVCEGELLQLANRNNWRLDERTYFEIIRRKTASLCGVCCQLSAVLAEAPQPVADALLEYGEGLGTAFQIVDDVLDLTGKPETVGKTLGRDIEKGKLTLPLIHCLTELPDAEAAYLTERLDRIGQMVFDHPQQAEELAAVRRQIERTDSLDYARQWAQRMIDRVKQVVGERLVDSPARQKLLSMADAVLTRRF